VSVQIPGAEHLRVERETPLSRVTTWRIGGPAEYLVRTATPDESIAVSRWAAVQGLPLTVLGGGSNILASDDGLRGLVLIAKASGERSDSLISWIDEGDTVLVTVGAQAPLSWVGRFAAEHGWAGLDWGVGLPGTIGGATVNNAGAHGTEQKDHLISIDILLPDGQRANKGREWLDPTYRMTRIKALATPRDHLVLNATMRLPKGDPALLTRLADEHAAYRKQTQPTGACAGSTFANPPGDFAGRLIEAAGLKGHAIGPVQFSTKHANFIVNGGGATAAHVRELIAHAQEVVRDRFGVHLETEVEFLGEHAEGT
jgi:UDP-N-acetylmuramate dehydrogenase